MTGTYERHYEKLSREGMLPSKCRMALTGVDLAGKRVLDVGCRRGKGVYKLSELVGPSGFVVGVDWDASYLEEARAGVSAALVRSGFAASNMEFRRAFPEDLATAGIGDGDFEMVYVNNGCMLFADPVRAVRECFRVLAPGGLLVLEAVVTGECESVGLLEGSTSNEDVSAEDAASNEGVSVTEVPPSTYLAAACTAGDSVSAARPHTEVERWLTAAGFAEIDVAEALPADFKASASPALIVFHARKASPLS